MKLRKLFIFTLLIVGCSKPPAAKTAKAPTVASLMPGATSLIVEMNASDHLVGVGSFDHLTPEIKDLPKIGDYANLDWERLNLLKPNLLILFIAPDRIPAELQRRADEKNIRLVNFRTERVSEVFDEIKTLGELLHEKEKADGLAAKIQSQLDGVRSRSEGLEKKRVLIVHDAEMRGVVGVNTFLDDLLTVAGGVNVATQSGWIQMDREQMLSSKPQVILHLLPEASDAADAQAKKSWNEMNLPAGVKVRILRSWHLLQPGPYIGKTAEEFQKALGE